MIHGIFKENQRAKYSKIVLMQPYSNINIGRRAEDFKCYASPLTKSAKAFLWQGEDHSTTISLQDFPTCWQSYAKVKAAPIVALQ